MTISIDAGNVHFAIFWDFLVDSDVGISLTMMKGRSRVYRGFRPSRFAAHMGLSIVRFESGCQLKPTGEWAFQSC
jgi:hypothetical protein